MWNMLKRHQNDFSGVFIVNSEHIAYLEFEYTFPASGVLFWSPWKLLDPLWWLEVSYSVDRWITLGCSCKGLSISTSAESVGNWQNLSSKKWTLTLPELQRFNYFCGVWGIFCYLYPQPDLVVTDIWKVWYGCLILVFEQYQAYLWWHPDLCAHCVVSMDSYVWINK